MIQEIIENKCDYAFILSESDPNINLVEDYLTHGRLFVYFKDQKPVSFIVTQQINHDTVEIKNLLTLENYRGHGFAKKLIKHVENIYKNIPTIMIGTANSSMANITFYTRLGYRYSHRIENFFIDYYPKEIYENGTQAVDLLYFTKSTIGFN